MRTATRTDISHRPIPTVRQAKGDAMLVTIARAAKAARVQQATMFVFPTYCKWSIDTRPPASGDFYEFGADGSAWKVEA